MKTQINQKNQKINTASKVYTKKLKAIKVLRIFNTSSTATSACSRKADFLFFPGSYIVLNLPFPKGGNCTMFIMWYFGDASLTEKIPSQTVLVPHALLFTDFIFPGNVILCFPQASDLSQMFEKKYRTQRNFTWTVQNFLCVKLGSKNEISHPVQSQKGDTLSKNICCAAFMLQKNIKDNRFTSLSCHNGVSYQKIIYHKRTQDVRIWVTLYSREKRFLANLNFCNSVWFTMVHD